MAYTEVSIKDALEVIDCTNLSDIISIQKLPGGWANSNYILQLKEGEKVVLKIWDEQSIEEVEYLLNMTYYLSNNGVPTPEPIRFNNGKLLIIKNNLAWSLLPFIEGNWLNSNPSSLYSLGQAQANLHMIKSPPGLKKDFSMGYQLFQKLFSIAEEKNEWTDFLYLLKKESTKLKDNFQKLPRGIIHGDLFPDNVIGSNDEVKSLIDFEETCNGILAFDLVMTFVGFGWENNLPVANHWHSLLKGYQSVRKLTEQEISALPDLHRLATLSIAAWRYWQFVINLPNTEHTNRYLEMTDRLDKELPF
jgi:homoserine kinase type II